MSELTEAVVALRLAVFWAGVMVTLALLAVAGSIQGRR